MMSQANGLFAAATILVIGCALLSIAAVVLRARDARKDFAESATEPKAS